MRGGRRWSGHRLRTGEDGRDGKAWTGEEARKWDEGTDEVTGSGRGMGKEVDDEGNER